MEREIASDFGLCLRDHLETSALEGDVGIFLNIEEVGTAEVIVARFYTSVDGLGWDGDTDFCACIVLASSSDLDVKVIEMTGHKRHASVLDVESDARVRFVVVPSGLCLQAEAREEHDEEEEKFLHCLICFVVMNVRVSDE